MLYKDNSSIYFLIEAGSHTMFNRFLGFLTSDLNFLYLDTTANKDVSAYHLNHKRVTTHNIIDGIRGNGRNLDHIILFIPLIYSSTYIQEVKEILDNENTPYSIVTSIHNQIDIVDKLEFDSVYVVESNQIMKKSEVITYDNFTLQYNRISTINAIINS
jgi:hypothetical protein